MPTNVLVPVDGHERAFAGLEYCFASFPDATITALYVVDPTRDHYATVGDVESPEQRSQDAADRVLETAESRAERHGRDLQTETRTGRPHTQILEHAVEENVDHVVVGSHGESPIAGTYLGRVGEAVVRRSPVTTTVVAEPPAELRERDLPGRVLVPVDGSEQATAALVYALEEFPDAAITALHVVDLPFDHSVGEVEGTYLESILEDLDERSEAILESASERADERDAALETDRAYGSPANEIVEYALDAAFDQLVMGIHGRSLAARLVTGSVAEAVAHRSPLTVTLVRGSPHGT